VKYSMHFPPLASLTFFLLEFPPEYQRRTRQFSPVPSSSTRLPFSAVPFFSTLGIRSGPLARGRTSVRFAPSGLVCCHFPSFVKALASNNPPYPFPFRPCELQTSKSDICPLPLLPCKPPTPGFPFPFFLFSPPETTSSPFRSPLFSLPLPVLAIATFFWSSQPFSIKINCFLILILCSLPFPL